MQLFLCWGAVWSWGGLQKPTERFDQSINGILSLLRLKRSLQPTTGWRWWNSSNRTVANTPLKRSTLLAELWRSSTWWSHHVSHSPPVTAHHVIRAITFTLIHDSGHWLIFFYFQLKFRLSRRLPRSLWHLRLLSPPRNRIPLCKCDCKIIQLKWVLKWIVVNTESRTKRRGKH